MPPSVNRYDAILAGLPTLLAGSLGVAWTSAVTITTAVATGCLLGFGLLADALVRNPPTNG
ncbi:hypothetical protein [Halocalculus aciditolerans]|uniref:Uncharacterized protein n=1 Tax=Halocalculus aciditolerans TaxID=1383812 RepID=A0A830F7F0_9EURY|nr:hypothetical protein [Halocalculus aciditolerans]GGL70637.1 hypothetical protein GCM10009039_30880 [Halocalculus aciditolerans]